jgi:peptidoglycan hydrolase-like protein with peptidoglycan-binding domain
MAMLNRILSLTFVSLLFVTAAFAQGGSSTATGNKEAAVAEEKTTAFRPTKDQIMQGQKFLKDQKLYSGEATGVYNADTRAAIKQYQKANSLALTGNFNQATLEKMNIALNDKQKGGSTATQKSATKALTGDSSSGPKRPGPFQATKEQIMELQKVLKDAKLFTGAADGERSDALEAAVTSYQKANGLKATGGINASTLDKMGIALTAKQKEQVAAQAAYDAAKSASKEQ